MTDSKVKAIFIGGTGRSGTTVLGKILNKHNQIYCFPQEIRFITDPDGLLSLQNSLVNDWSKFHSDFGMTRFICLMDHLRIKYKGRYPNHGLSDLVTQEFYDSWVKDFTNELIGHSFKSGWAARVNIFNKSLIKILGKNAITEKFLNNSFYCPPLSLEDFEKKACKFILNFFHQAAILNNSKMVIEHTPSNLLHFGFILNMIPNAKLIHIYRDPRDVICSYKTKDWGSSDIGENANWIKDVLNQWELKKRSLHSSSFLELSFEELIFSFESKMKTICEFLEISFDDKFKDVDLSHHNIDRWKKDLDADEKVILNEKFSDLVDLYGY